MRYGTTSQYTEKRPPLGLVFDDFDEQLLGARRADRATGSGSCMSNWKSQI